MLAPKNGQMVRIASRMDMPEVENIPIPVKRVNIPTPEEMTLILDALEPRTGLLVRFLAESGCRKSEAFNLEWADVDYEQCLVMIRRKEGFTPKTKHHRQPTLRTWMMPEITRRSSTRRAPPLFLGNSGSMTAHC